MAPVVRELGKRSDDFESIVCVTAQHRQLLDQALDLFGIKPDYDLNLMQENQTLAGLTSKILVTVDRVLAEVKPDWVLVQGDTTSTMAASLGAFYRDIRIGHVEAGLRTNDNRAPFPEEINRRVTSVLADLHFAPTGGARKALLAEGVPAERVIVTGNTVIDALLWAREQIRIHPPAISAAIRKAIDGRRLILVTGHRRESFGEPFRQICLAIREIAQAHPDVSIIYPVHLNPNVQRPVHEILASQDRVTLTEPIPYAPFVWLMDNAYLILTDSGGIQEEAPSLGKPVLVMREVTERPEGVNAGCARLVGVDYTRIVDGVTRLLCDSTAYHQMSAVKNPYGDGKAAEYIVSALLDTGSGKQNPLSIKQGLGVWSP